MTSQTVDRRDVAPPATAGRWPDFIIIGAMKSGTTTLYERLSGHPRIMMCEPKEPMFFSRESVRARGEGWYRGLFADAGPEQVCGEASTCYSRWPHFGEVAGRIAAVMPDVKLIYIMRHPVDRAYSHYGWEMRHRVTMTFEEAMECDPAIIDASLYMRQIEQYLKHFRREQLLLLTLDDLRNEPDRVLAECQRFLGLPVMTLPGSEAANRAGDVTARKRLMTALKTVRRWPVMRQVMDLLPGHWRSALYERLLEAGQQSFIGRAIARRHKRKLSPLSPQTRERLLKRFEEPTRELEHFLGRELPEWKR